MAFDFKGGSSGSGAPFPPSASGGGFRDKPGGFGGGPAADRPPKSPKRPSPGFQDRPGRSMPSPDPVRRAAPPAEPRPRPHPPVRRPPMRSRSPRFSLPWGRVLPVLAVLALLVVCFVFRSAITAFLMDLLTWAIILLVVIYIFKCLLFGGKR